MEKSGKLSCCGRGGSWFRNCGGARNAKLDHTWYDGILTCKAWAQSKPAIGQQLNVAQEKGTDPANDADTMNSKAVITTAKTITFTPTNMSTPMPGTMTIFAPAYTGTNASTHTSISTSIPYDTDTANSKGITVEATITIITTSTSMSTPMPAITLVQHFSRQLISQHINLHVIPHAND